MPVYAFLGLSHPASAGKRSSYSSKLIALEIRRRFDVCQRMEFGMVSNGTIKRLVTDKGFGFVVDQSGSEYFFHQSACQGTPFDELREGQPVTFQTGQGPKGPRAERVTPA